MYKHFFFLFFLLFNNIVESRKAFINLHKNNVLNNKITVSNPHTKNVLYQTSPKISLSQAITKKQIIEEVAMETKESKKTVEKIMNGIFDNIYKHLENDRKIYIHKFGIYYNVFRKKRCIKNVKTKEEIEVESCHSPYFKFSKIFKNLIKNNVKPQKRTNENIENENENEDEFDEEDEYESEDDDDDDDNLNKRRMNESFNENLNEKLIY